MMNKQDLDFIISEGEGYNLEFKESFSSEISKEICAFANSNGGKILVGVSDGKKVKGIQITNRLKSQIQDLARNIDPKINIIIEDVNNVLVMIVPEGKNKPYSVNGRFYVRQGTNSQQLTRDEIREFFQKEGRITFDEKVNDKFDICSDLNRKAFETFLERAKISHILPNEEILNNLDLIEDKKIKNAGVLLFCNQISHFFLNGTITCVLFLGKDKSNILDKKEFDRDIYSNYLAVIDYIKSKLNTEYIIKTAGPREEKLELPEETIKEALLNAIVHRDYFSNAEIQVYIFKDRIEIVNPGGLVPGMKFEDLGKKSLSRNKLLFGLLQRMDVIEKAGTGIARMRKTLREYRLKAPVIETDENWFTVTFARPDLQKESYEQRFYEAKKDRLVEGLVEWLVESQRRILELTKNNPQISKAEMAEKIGISTTAIDKNIEKLKEKGLLRRVGPDKGGKWEVKE